jgi:predicted Zn-dependent protease
LTRRARLARELGVVCAALALLAIAAFAAQRLFFPREKTAVDVPQAFDDALRPIMMSQVLSTQKVVKSREVGNAFDAIMRRLTAAMPPLSVEDRKVAVEDRKVAVEDRKVAVEDRKVAVEDRKVAVVVIDSPEINAFTLPGRIVCVDTGLLRQLDSAEEMAAVLGHELSHVFHRDPLSLLARQIGMATLASVVTGGQGAEVLQSMVQTMVNVHYGREAEDRADAFSVHLLADAGIAPGSFARALARIRDSAPKEPGLLKYLDPHSPIDSRIEKAEEQARREHVALQKLPVDWKALVESLPGK